jgi:hypothetical protein
VRHLNYPLSDYYVVSALHPDERSSNAYNLARRRLPDGPKNPLHQGGDSDGRWQLLHILESGGSSRPPHNSNTLARKDVRYWVEEGTGCQYEMASDALETFPAIRPESFLLRLLLLTYGVVYYSRQMISVSLSVGRASAVANTMED